MNKNRFGMPALLVGAAGLAFALPAMAQLSEVEPNETKAQALTNGTFVMPLANGAALTGTTTGTSTTVAGLASADTWLVRPNNLAAGIWRHRLVLTSTTVGHVGTLRGLNQSSVGTIGTTDSALQTSSTATTPARYNQWYSFGGESSTLYYRVTGGTATTAPYVANYEVQAVTPIVISGTITAGSVQIRDTGTNDIDFWVYDSSFNPIVGFGNDEPEASGVTRSMTPGTYYIAMARFNGANNLASAAPETFAGSVMDFPGSYMSSSNTAGTVIPTITSAAGTVTATTTTYVANTNAFDVAWYQFTVTAPVNPVVNSVVSTPASGSIGQTFVVVANVSTAPDLVPISTVSLDASQVDAGTVALNDSGIAPDAVSGDGNWSGNVTIGAAATLGANTLTATATDNSARVATGTGTFSVVPAIPPCPAGTVVVSGTNLNSSAPVGDVNNGVALNTVSGAGVVNAIRVSGLAEEINEATFASEARVRVITPSGAFYDFQFTTATAFPIADDFLSVASQELLIPGESANGNWRVEVFESFDDGGPTSVDATWRGICVSAANVSTPPIVSNITTSNPAIFIGGSPSTTVVTAQVSPGTLPASTNLQVSINGAPAGLGTIAMNDLGVAPDATPGDGIWSATLDSAGSTLGVYTLTITASDDEIRSGTGTFGQTIDAADQTGESVATANLAPDASTFNGRLNTGTDVDMWKIFICDPAAFSATTVGGLTVPGTATGSDTALYLFSPDGNGISYNDDVTGTDFNSLLANTQVASLSAGEYYLAVAYFGNRPTNASAQTIWSEFAPTATVPPTGLGAPGPVADWNGLGTTVANYTLTLTGVSLAACGPTCNDIDVNNDGASFDPTDIDAFLSVYGEGPCIPDTATCDGIDFNNDGSLFDPCDIDSFLLVFSEGPCTLCGV